ncbi:kinase-interacting protein 1 [Coffea eugenioides]|uniref:kinase-interacting protein 1 n=1 Tax=Coffea eugenioides TaxID=49369 RepID=UPI000F60BEBB|nr:kinase-interacting protein 1 [Coffea eugenioides]
MLCYLLTLDGFADMEEKVQYILKLIEEDGDSFAKRAEMYYKKRPELITFVEESYRAFRALAERYDHLSTELQNANNTLATLFPDQIQLAMDDEDDFSSPKLPKGFPQVLNANAPTVPKVPKAPIRDWKGLINASKNLKAKKLSIADEAKRTDAKSGLTKSEAFAEIDKLQKDILGLQTVKEFVKSSYQSGLSKYWGIENQIMEKQQRVCSLQDEFGVDKVIEDNEARTLMAEAALKSCQETLVQLQEKQEKFNQEAREEYKKIEDARKKLKSIRREFLHDQTIDEEEKANEKEDKSATAGDKAERSNQEVGGAIKEIQVKGIEVGSLGSLTVSQLAEKIDDLVNKVINLETAVSSQTVLIDRMKTEADELHSQIRVLEEDKANLIHDTQNLNTRVKKIEDKLHGIQDLNQNVEKQNNHLQTNFAEARSSLGHLSEKLNSVKPDEEIEITTITTERSDPANAVDDAECRTSNSEDIKDIKEQDSGESVNDQGQEGHKAAKKTVTFQNPIAKIRVDENNAAKKGDLSSAGSKVETEKKDDFNWQQMLLSGMEDKEKILLAEYTTILRNYKDTKKKLTDMEKARNHQFELALQIRGLRVTVAKRDEEIRCLRKRLDAQQGEGRDVKEDDRILKPEAGSTKDLASDVPLVDNEDEAIKSILMEQPMVMSQVEEKLRMEIDAILDENLDFWLRFSTTFHQVQKFRTTVQDLEQEISILKEKKKQEESASDLKSEVRPIYKHLKEIRAELTVWLERSVVLKAELERRFSSLCSIQERITTALKEGVEDEEIRFSSHQAAKFQGEILNMKQENNMVSAELQAGADHVSKLQTEIDKTLRMLDEEFELTVNNQPQLTHTASRSKIPLRSFIFGTKLKKQKHSIFSFNRKYQTLRAGLPL